VSALFAFVQFEFTHAIGPHAGRYVVANPDTADSDGAAPRTDELPRREMLTGVTMRAGAADVLAITVAEGKPVRQRLRRRAKEEGAPDDATGDVPLLLATFVRGTEPLADRKVADRALETVGRSEDDQQAIVADGLRVLNAAIRAYRAGARDPYVKEVAQRDARRVRIGYGTSEEVTAGRWRRAIVLPPPAGTRMSRTEKLLPAETTAEVLSGRGQILEAEDVLLRVWADLDHGRVRAAALQAQAATRLLATELAERDATDDKLEELRAQADRLAVAALEGADVVADLEQLVDRLNRAVERWRYAGVEL
jgi:hypothetical protein